MNEFHKQTRILFIGAITILLMLLFFLKITPLGRVTYYYDFNKYSSFIHKFKPLERLMTTDKIFPNTAQGNPIYFSVRAPHHFDRAELEFKYRRHDTKTAANIIEVGALVDRVNWRYSLQSLENSVIDQATDKWTVSKDANLFLLQRFNRYASVADFLANPPEGNEIATYQANFDNDFHFNSYVSSDQERRINVGLRDQFQFYTYIKDEELDFIFEIVDLNQKREAVNVEALLYENDKIIKKVQLIDDGIVDGSGVAGEMRRLELKMNGLAEGRKKVELRASSDIVTRSITTKQNKIAFLNKIYLNNSDEVDIRIFTKAKKINFQTPHPDSLQKISLNEDIFDFNEAYKQFQFVVGNISSSANVIHLEKDGVIISSNDLFAFSSDQYFNPEIKKVDNETSLGADGINYILTSYQPQKKVADWQVRSVGIDLQSAITDKDGLSFIVSVPDLEREGRIEFDYVKITLEADNILVRFKKGIHRFSTLLRGVTTK